MIDLTVLDSLSLGEFGGGVQLFGEFGASGRARTMKIGRRCQGSAQIDLIKSFSQIRPSGGLKGEKKLGIYNLRLGDRILMNFDI